MTYHPIREGLTAVEILIYVAVGLGFAAALTGSGTRVGASSLLALAACVMLVASAVTLFDIRSNAQRLYRRAQHPPGIRALTTRGLPIGPYWLFRISYGLALGLIGAGLGVGAGVWAA